MERGKEQGVHGIETRRSGWHFFLPLLMMKTRPRSAQDRLYELRQRQRTTNARHSQVTLTQVYSRVSFSDGCLEVRYSCPLSGRTQTAI